MPPRHRNSTDKQVVTATRPESDGAISDCVQGGDCFVADARRNDRDADTRVEPSPEGDARPSRPPGPLLAAFRFLTVLPAPGPHDFPDAGWAAATAWYPLTGLVLGSFLALSAWGLAWLWPGGVVAALVLVAWVIFTGGLHLDGFVDCCDALFASISPERRLEIMRDVHTGAFGVAGVVLLLLAKYAALATMVAAANRIVPGGWLPLVLIPTTARWGMTAALVLYPYARSGPGLGARAKQGAGTRQLAIATAISLLAVAATCWAGLGWGALAIVVAMVATMFVAAQWIRSRIGGLTGDTYGALCELGETAGLLAATALLFQGGMF